MDILRLRSFARTKASTHENGVIIGHFEEVFPPHLLTLFDLDRIFIKETLKFWAQAEANQIPLIFLGA